MVNYTNFIRELIDVEEGNMIDLIWKYLCKTWDYQQYKSVDEYYSRGEEITNEIEVFLNSTFYEIYDIIYEKSTSHRSDLSGANIIMDGMSIREGTLIREELKKRGFKVSLSYSYSSLPSITEEFRKQHSISNFYHVKHGKIDFDYLTEDFIVWITYPDELLHHVEKIITPSEAFEKTKDVLLDVLDRIESSEVKILSDHGYILAERVWAIPNGDAKYIKSIFKNERFVKISEIKPKDLERLKKVPKDLSYVKIGKDWCFMRGRYSLPVGRKSIVHGGLSLMECIVPKLEVKL